MNYTEPTTQFRTDFFRLCDSAQKIIITSHESPDDDSIASVLTTFQVLTDKYPSKDIRIIYTGKPVDRYKSFTNYDRIEFVPDLADRLDQVDLLIMLDGNTHNRFSFKPNQITTVRHTICIDHHSNPPSDFTLSLISPHSPSNSELIYQVLCDDQPLTPELAQTFLLGILGDTGNFAYLDPSNSGTLLITEKLLKMAQIEIQELQSRYRTISKNVFKLTQELVRNSQFGSVSGWPNFQYSFLTRDFVTDKYTDVEISAAQHLFLAQYVRTVIDYPWGFTITPDTNGDFGISIRALPGTIQANLIVQGLGVGGGHPLAAGGTFRKTDSGPTADICVKQIIDYLKTHPNTK